MVFESHDQRAAQLLTLGLYVADRLARELDEYPDHAKATPLGEPDDALMEALGLSQQYPVLPERAMELFA